MNFLEALKGLFTANMSINFLSNLLNRKTTHHHYYNPVIVKVVDDESALKIAREIPHAIIENDTIRSAASEPCCAEESGQYPVGAGNRPASADEESAAPNQGT